MGQDLKTLAAWAAAEGINFAKRLIGLARRTQTAAQQPPPMLGAMIVEMYKGVVAAENGQDRQGKLKRVLESCDRIMGGSMMDFEQMWPVDSASGLRIRAAIGEYRSYLAELARSVN